MCSITEEAEIALTSADLLDLNTPLLSSGSSRAINAAAASSELAAEHCAYLENSGEFLQGFHHSFYPNESCRSRGIAGRWAQQRGAGRQGMPLLGEEAGVRLESFLPLELLCPCFLCCTGGEKAGKASLVQPGDGAHTPGPSCPIRIPFRQGELLTHSSGNGTGSFPLAGIVSHAAKNSPLAIFLLHIWIAQKTQLGQKFWDNMSFSCFWMGNWIFWHIKRLQNEKKKKKNQGFVLINLHFLREWRARESLC